MDNEKDKMYIPDIEGVVQPERFGKNLFDYNSDEAKDKDTLEKRMSDAKKKNEENRKKEIEIEKENNIREEREETERMR